MIDDYEPEDAWDASDAIDDQITNLARRIALLDGMPEPFALTRETLLDIIHERIELRRRSSPLAGRDLLRALQLLDDLRTVRERLP